MREIRMSGSEGGAGGIPLLPLSKRGRDSDTVISLAFWSAVVLHRFSMQQKNPAHLSKFPPVRNG